MHDNICVADVHLTEVPIYNAYSGILALRGLRKILFLAEFNDLDTWVTDTRNVYLEAKTSEKFIL